MFLNQFEENEAIEKTTIPDKKTVDFSALINLTNF